MEAGAYLPAVCDVCGGVFEPSAIKLAPGASVSVSNVSVGPCPYCGGTGRIPDGFYEFTGEALRLLSSWSAERLKRFADAIQAARNAPNPNAAAQAAIENEPGLEGLAQRLSPLRDASAFWGFIAVILATIALLTADDDTHVTVNEKTVIERVVTAPNPAPSQIVTPPAKTKAQKGSLARKQQREKKHGKGRRR